MTSKLSKRDTLPEIDVSPRFVVIKLSLQLMSLLESWVYGCMCYKSTNHGS